MPPVAKAGGTAFRKDVDFVTKDDDEQVASGIVMVPDKADLQNDYAREGTIRDFAEQFAAFEDANQAGGGIMHAVWPDGWMNLERNEVLDEAEEIGGTTVDAGSWVQDWSIENDQLWNDITDGILEGYSIGAIQVDWDGPFEQDEVDDVDTSGVPEDELVWELTDGIIREVSAVDIPAVPDAEILEAKSLEKRLAEHIGNPDAFLEEAMERGHTEAEAERLWDLLNAAMEADGASEPGKQSMLQRAGKAFLGALSGSDDDDRSEALDSPATQKEGRTLSKQNRDSLMASIDAGLDVLQDAGAVPEDMTRFTDRDDVDFDLTEHSARTWEGDHGPDDEEEEEEEMASTTDDAPEGDTSEGGSTDAVDDMTDENTNTDDPGEETDLTERVEQNAEQLEEYSDQMEELTSTVNDIAEAVADDGEEKTVEVETPDGEVYEVSESEAKSWFDGDEAGASSDPFADAPEWAKHLKDRADENAARIERINQQSGQSQQLDRSAGGDANEENPLDGLGKALN